MNAMDNTLSIQMNKSIRAISKQNWNSLALPYGNPFVRFEFLSALEDSGCVSGETGWQPLHLTIRSDHDLLACMPLYLKSHSMGEYVFDQGWADAYMRAGGQYYPKLQSSIPFTPVTGPRLLVSPDTDSQLLFETAAKALKGLCNQHQFSSAHITFAEFDERPKWEKNNFLVRQDQQFHWENQGYANFNDFLDALSARKRKQIKKERRVLDDHNLTICALRGIEIEEQHWDIFYQFYVDTAARKWGQPYLNREFFSQINRSMTDQILLFLVYDSYDRPVAGALNFIGSESLYGRYWGTTSDIPNLHFEVCYYQAIEFAIQHGLSRVEAGAQGTHKLARGYTPHITYSLHWIEDSYFREAVSDFLTRESIATEEELSYIRVHHSPYKK